MFDGSLPLVRDWFKFDDLEVDGEILTICAMLDNDDRIDSNDVGLVKSGRSAPEFDAERGLLSGLNKPDKFFLITFKVVELPLRSTAPLSFLFALAFAIFSKALVTSTRNFPKMFWVYHMATIATVSSVKLRGRAGPWYNPSLTV